MVEQAFARELGSLEAIRGFAREALGRWSVPEDLAWDVDLVLEELFTNVLKYGRASGAPVFVSLDWCAPRLTLGVRDTDSDFFDPTAVPTPDVQRPVEELRPGGLGLHIIRKLAERFAYSYEGRESLTTVILRVES